jgi:hypothetical protein
MSAISVSSHHHSSHLTQTRYSDVEISSPAPAPFDFLAAYSNPFLDGYVYPTPPQPPICTDSLPFLNCSSTVLNQPISAFITYPPPALSSYSTALSPMAEFRASLSPSQDNALEDSLRYLPNTPINSGAICFPSLFPQSTDELPNNSPSFNLNNSPFRTLDDTNLPTLSDSTSSPVVRRSKGDVTPLFGRGGEIIHLPNQPKLHRDIFLEDGSANSFSIAQIPNSHSPTLQRRSTPFLQRLRQCSDVLSPWGDTNPALPLSSPFILKSHSTQFVSPEIAATRAAQTPSAERITGLSNSCAKLKYLLSLDSPLSEASSHSPVRPPIPSDLQAMFEKEDRMHGMSMRSRSKASSSSHPASKSSMLGTSTCQRQKRKYMVESKMDNDDANPASSDDEILSSPLQKKRKTLGGIGSLARRNAAPNKSTSRGTGGGNYSSQANRSPGVDTYTPRM